MWGLGHEGKKNDVLLQSDTQNRDTIQFFGRVEDIFAVSKCLPPARSDDHIILLLQEVVHK